jgi:hypothetical protein
MQRLSSFVLLLVFLFLLHSIPLQAASDSIQMTSASVICGSQYGNLGATYSLTATYTADGHRIIDEFMIIADYGGRIDQYHHIDAGSATLSGGGGMYGGSWNGATYGPPAYPYTVELVLELYAATTIDYVNGSNVINGPMVARSAASAVCTQEGPAQVIITEGTSSGPGSDPDSDPDSGPGQPFDPADGRINPDPAAPVAIYCYEYGIDIYRINVDSAGLLIIAATNAEIDAVGETPVVNTVIEGYDNVRLYRLATGQFQVNAGPDAEGKEYVFIWDEC